MKRNAFIIFFFLFSTYGMQAQVTSPNELIHKIFTSLKAKDESAFLALCPDSTQLVQIMKKYEQDEIAKFKAFLGKPYTINGKESLERFRVALQKRHSPTEIQKFRNEFRENFHRIIETGEKGGVDWTAITFTNYTFDSVKGANSLYGQELFGSKDYQSLSGKVFFKDRDSTCQIWFSDLLFSNKEKKWYAGTLEMIVLPGMEVRDVVIQNIEVDQSTPPPPPRPRNKKPSTKKRQPPKP